MLQTRINLAGFLILLAHLAMTLVSLPQAATLWDGEFAPRTHEFFARLADAVPGFPLKTLFENNRAVVIWHLVPMTVATAAALALWLRLARSPDEANDRSVVLMLRWAIAFAVVSFFAFPVFTQDFWLSAAWGRMIAQGHNPYYVDMIDEATTGMPLDHFAMRMPYAPLWGWASALIMLVSGESALVAGTIFKAVLTVAWIATVLIVERLTRNDGPLARCVALLLIGWLPVSVGQAVAEAHNDVAMVALMMLWWLLLRKGAGWLGSTALAASAVCKYVSVSLFLVDAIHALRVERLSLWRYALRLVVPGLVIMGAMLPFVRDHEFMDGIRMIGSWQFMHLRDTFGLLGRLAGLPLEFLAIAAQLVFAGTALYYLVQSFRAPSVEVLNRTLVAVMAFMLFAASPHLWAWYLIWVLPLAALVPHWWLSRFVIGAALIAPFIVGFWWVDEIEGHKDAAALLLHGGALAWTIATHRLASPRVQRA